MENVRDTIRKTVLALWKPSLGSVLVGIVTGLLGAALWHILDWCTADFDANAWLVFLLPAGGMLIALMYSRAPHVGGTNQVLEAVRGESKLSPLMVPLIYAGTVLTRVFGGSVGSEGAAIQIGGGTADIFGRWLKMDARQLRILLMSGISGGFASVVGTPATAVMLAIELTGSGVMLYEAILPCSAASALSYSIAAGMGVSFPKITMDSASVAGLPGFPEIVQVVALAAMGGVVSIVLCKAIDCSARWYAKLIPSTILRAIAGGALLVGLTYLVRTTAFNGGGLNLLEAAAAGQSAPYDFALKILFTALTIGAGYRGGAIVPTIATGAAFGGFMGPLIGTSPSLGACIGVTSVFCGAINCPMTSFVLGIEVFGADAALLIVLSCAVGYVCSGYTSLYSAQIIRLSKLDGHVINRHAR